VKLKTTLAALALFASGTASAAPLVIDVKGITTLTIDGLPDVLSLVPGLGLEEVTVLGVVEKVMGLVPTVVLIDDLKAVHLDDVLALLPPLPGLE
jgi:hypothetical protein